ncbi:MAG: NUDIX domain-containing protein [Proteobacteria bacterium]|nr:NUDIX domain-containing protein [Pseudomonadota bacterium]MBI3496789.1 NUDIX domain-containing protein [Pseudomonadota bacterium]
MVAYVPSPEAETAGYAILSKETVFKGFFRVDRFHLRHRLFAGGWSQEIEREIFQRGHAAGVLPYDPVLDRVVLVEQFRTAALVAGLHPWTIEVPAGIIGKDEAPDAVARRESVEETGCAVEALIPLYEFMPSPGGSSEVVWLFAALVDTTHSGGLAGVAHEHEDIRVVVLDYAEAIERLQAGRIENAITIMSLQWLMMNRERLRRERLSR